MDPQRRADMRHALALHLRDFSAPRPAPDRAAAEPPPRDTEAELREAHAAGFAAGREAGRTEAKRHLAASSAEREMRFQHLVADARASWMEETADRLAAEVERAVSKAADVLAVDLARVLEGVAALARRSFVVNDLVTRLGPLLRDADVVSLQMSGPSDLMQALRTRLDPRHEISETACEGGDITVRVNRTIVAARLEAWRALLLAAVEGAT